MSQGASILQVFETALGERPSGRAGRGRRLNERDLERIVGAWRTQGLEADVPRRDPHEIWPLISHHPFAGHTLFGGRAGTTMLPRVLAVLLAHDGIVAANPLTDIARLLAHDQINNALELAEDVVAGLATCEPLIDRGVLRFTDHRPALTDDARRAVLGAFNLDPKLTVFTDFLEAAVALPQLPERYSTHYLRQATELFVVMGLTGPELADVDHAASAIRALASAVIEVTWQLAVCSTDPSCDLALVTPLERELTDVVLGEASVVASAERMRTRRTRHLARLNAGNIPNLDTGHLSIADTLAIRESDAFEEFRGLLRSALDTLDKGQRTGQNPAGLQAEFEDRMTDGARELGTRVKKSSLQARLRDTSVPVVLGAVSAGLLAPRGPGFSAVGAAAASLSGTLWQWLTARGTPTGTTVGRRYASMLSGVDAVAPDRQTESRGR